MMHVWKKQSQKTSWLGIAGIALGVLGVGVWLTVRSPFLGVLAAAIGVGFATALVWSATLTHRRLIITLLVSSILLPGIPVPGLLQVRLEELIVLALLPVILTRIRGRLNRVDVCFGLVGISTMISMAWGQWGKGIFLSPRDFMELIKLVKFWLFFRLTLYRWTEDDLRSITYWLLGSIGIAALVGLVQWKNWMGIGMLTKMLYGQGSVHVSKVRVIGTVESPIYFSLLMVAGQSFIVSALQWYKHKWVLVALWGLCLAIVTFTSSRTGILAVGIVLSVTVGLRIIWLRRISLRWWLISVAVALVVVLMIRFTAGTWLLNELESLEVMNAVEKFEYSQQGPIHYFVFRFDALEEGKNARIAMWQDNLAIFQESPLIGWGPGKSVQGTITDNGYVLYLRRYGVIGLAFYLLLYWQVLRFCWKLLRIYPYQSVMWAMGLAILAITLAYLAANMFVEVIYELQLMSVFWLIVGIGYSALYFRTEEHKKLVCKA